MPHYLKTTQKVATYIRLAPRTISHYSRTNRVNFVDVGISLKEKVDDVEMAFLHGQHEVRAIVRSVCNDVSIDIVVEGQLN